MTDGESKPNEESGQELEQPLNSEYRVEELQDDVIEDLFVPAFEQLDRLLANLPDDQQDQYRTLCHKYAQNPNVVSGFTRIQGILFELSRYADVKSSGLEELSGIDMPELSVEYHGFDKKADLSIATPTKVRKSKIDFDVPIVRDGEPYAYETKSATRREYGSLPEQRNQLLKYQQAIEDQQIAGSTVEIRGRVNAEFLEWATGEGVGNAGPIPNVEIIYTLELPSGAEYRFTLKHSSGADGLKFENPVYDDPEDLRVIGGVQRSILNRTIHHIIASSPNGYGDPREITDFTEYAEYDKARVDNLYEQFGSEVDSAIVNDDNEQSAYSDETTRESVELLISELQTYLRQNAQATKQKKEYILTEEQEALVLDEAMRRIGLISQIELARVSSQQEVEARKTRAELGYSDVLQPEGIALDVEHIVMDSIQSVKKGISRSYEDRGRFMDVDGLVEYLSPELDREEREVVVFDPQTGESRTLTNVSEQGMQKAQDAMTKGNVELALELVRYSIDYHKYLVGKSDRTADEEAVQVELGAHVRGFNQNAQIIGNLQNEILRLNQEKVDRIKAAENSDKKAINEEYTVKIRELYGSLQEVLIPVVGGQEHWDKFAERVVSDKTTNNIKFIYTIDANGEVRVDEEKIRGAVTGRAAHSELAGGQNVYGAGELVFTKRDGDWILVEINNGSGHYRPSSLTLPYVKNVLAGNGLGTDQVILTDSLLRGSQLPDEASLM